MLDELSFTDDHSFIRLGNKHGIRLVEQCIAAGYVLRRDDYTLRITQAGAARLAGLRALLFSAEQESQYQANQDAKQKRGAFRSWVQFFLGIFLGWLLGGITPHEVWQLIFDFFQKALH